MGKKKVAKKASGAGRAGYSEVDERGCGEVCPMCSEVIVEASEDTEGQDAIFCDGAECQVWHHRWCAGVTKRRYKILDSSA